MVSKKAAPTRINSCTQDKVFMVVLHVVLAFILVVVVYPLLFVLFASVSDPQYVNSGALLLYPKGFNLLGYQQVFRDQRILIGYGNTIYYTVLGSALAVAVNMMAGYALSRDDLPGARDCDGAVRVYDVLWRRHDTVLPDSAQSAPDQYAHYTGVAGRHVGI